MGVTRTDLYTAQQNEMALAAKALAHPARVAIIDCLLQANACITGDLVLEIGLAQATISQHLRELKEAGIIQGTIEGASVRYCINADRWNEISKNFNKLFDRYQDTTCC
jgi:DNA-binding transcriptional ArsR family regulator